MRFLVETTAQVRRFCDVEAGSADEAEAIVRECGSELCVQEKDISEEIDDVSCADAAAGGQGAPADALRGVA